MRVRAAVMPARSGRWAIVPLEIAEPGPREVLVRVVASGICQTDVHARDGFFPMPWPAVYGHEGAGIVERVGAGGTTLAPGDAVLMANPACGECPDCLDGYESYCVHAARLKQSGLRADGSIALGDGETPVYGSFFQQSSFATHALATERNTIRIPAAAALDVAAAFPCGVNTGAGAVMNVLKPRAGESFVVFGAGTVGLAGVMAARLAGCDPIVVVDRFESRLALARELGATHAVSANDRNLVAEVKRAVGGRGARLSLEAAGFPDALRAAVEVLAPRGVCCLTGSARAGTEVALEMRHVQQGRTVRGCVQGESRVREFLPRLVDLHLAGHLPVERLVRHYAFERINEAVEDMLAGRTIKAVLRIADA